VKGNVTLVKSGFIEAYALAKNSPVKGDTTLSEINSMKGNSIP